MPTYQYACQNCGHQFEKRQRFNEQPLTTCPNCTGTVQRVINPVGIIFKGPGFYITDNKSGSKNNIAKTPDAKPATNGNSNGVSKDKSSDSKKETAKVASTE